MARRNRTAPKHGASGAWTAGAAALAAAAAVAATRRLVQAKIEAKTERAERWTRRNFRGDAVSLRQGPAMLAGLAAGEVTRWSMGPKQGPGDRSRHVAPLVVITTAGALGLLDDLTEDQRAVAKGLRGHLGALREGRLTTGAAKLLGISGASAVAAILVSRARGAGSKPAQVVDVVTDTALIAGMTNLVNLFDLRPGRALKVGAALAMPLGTSAAAIAGAIAAAAPADLGAREMSGDSGANALGAAIGAGWAIVMPRGVRIGGALGIAFLTVASEKVSFSKVIARTAVLRKLDQWLVVPAPPAVPAPPDEPPGDAGTVVP